MDTAALRHKFTSLFPGASDSLIEARAPGRVNLIGEHTDYNEGYVCPMALDRDTVVLARRRTDGKIRIFSTATEQMAEWSIDREVPKGAPAWALYPKGVAEALRQKGMLNTGVDALADSTVPVGGGLSSSASFEVAMIMALLAASHQEMSPVDIALACQWAEHHYPGMPCGIMDQFISVMGEKGHALLLDCRDHSMRQVPLTDPKLRVVIANSNVKHELVQGEYTARRHQCETAVRNLQKRFPAIHSLRDATLDQLDDVRMGMDPTAFKRGRHVITEIKRCLDFAAAMEKQNYAGAGVLMYASHESLRDDYAVSCPELDALVDIARSVPGVYGARMTGGGFGGCIVALTQVDAVDKLTQHLETEYPKRCGGKKTTVFATVASQGARIVSK